MTKYDVFISSKSEDYRIANDVYNFLASNDVKVFFADAQLKELGTSEYSDVIDNVIDSVKHMIVVGSKIEYIESKWVKTEWRAFTDEIRAGRKNGNIITILDGLSPAELPLALRNVQSFPADSYKDAILPYVYVDATHEQKTIVNRTSNDILLLLSNKYFIFKLVAILLLSFITFILLPNICVSTSEIHTFLDEQKESHEKKEKKHKIDNLDVSIKYLAGQMDSAYNVARRISTTLEENPITELQPMEEGTLEYTASDKSKYTLCQYYEFTDNDSLLLEYVNCLLLYDTDFKKIDSLIDVREKTVQSRTGGYYNHSFAEEKEALFTLILRNPFKIIVNILCLLLFVGIFIVLFLLFDKRTQTHRLFLKYFRKYIRIC